MKKLVIMSLAILLFINPISVFASSSTVGWINKANVYSNSDYYGVKESYELYVASSSVAYMMITAITDENGVEKEYKISVIDQQRFWLDLYCADRFTFGIYDSNGNQLDQMQVGTQLNACSNGEYIGFSDYLADEKRYASDTKKGTVEPIEPPTKPELSIEIFDKNGVSQGYLPGSTNNTGGGDGGNPSPTDPSNPNPTEPTEPEYEYPLWCDEECRVFECPQWDEYMYKLDQIKNAIPPPPNWQSVANIMRDTIVPNLMNEVKSYFGSVGNAPATPPNLPSLDTQNIENKAPTFNVPAGLNEAGFSANDIKQQAPIIQERPDESGGFDLTADPLESLPEVPNVVLPGQTQEKNWMEMPSDYSNPFPSNPQSSVNNVDITNPPTPNGNNNTAPIPGGTSENNAPIPGGSGSGHSNHLLDYKPSPNAPDGSGGNL